MAFKINGHKKGQSTVEYIIMVATVISLLLVFLRSGGVFQNSFINSMNTLSSQMPEMAERLSAVTARRGSPIPTDIGGTHAP